MKEHLRRDCVFAADSECPAADLTAIAASVGVIPGQVVQMPAGAENLCGILWELQLSVAISR